MDRADVAPWWRSSPNPTGRRSRWDGRHKDSIRTAGLTKNFGDLRAVIDYTRQDFADGQRHYDVILDVGGASTLSRLRRALAPTGRLVIVGSETGGRLLGGFGRTLRAPLPSPFVSQDPGPTRRTTRTCSS